MWQSILEHFASSTVLVVGDVMLDEYAWGDVQRISPEAPVPIVEVRRRSYTPGGAANVAVNIAALGGQVTLVGVVGNDNTATTLCSALRERNVSTACLLVEDDRPTTAKLRIVAHSQQIVRVDAESRTPLAKSTEDALISAIDRSIEASMVCVLSDYGKGVVTERVAQHLIMVARRADKPVIVDPKGVDYSKYRSASIVTPNLREAEQAAHIAIDDQSDIVRAGRRLLEMLDSPAVLITCGADGMMLFTGNTTSHIPSVARTVFDVTGAGDTVVGTLALALAARAPVDVAAHLANMAAGLVVGKAGAATVAISEMIDVLPNNSNINTVL